MEQFLAEHSLYVVLLVVLTIWGGIAFFLVWLERKLVVLERAGAASKNTGADPTR